MKITHLSIPDVLVIEPMVFEDDRGFFFESFNLKEFREATTKNILFVQDNHSKSSKGILRGLHYQLPPNAQGKLVRVIEGEVLDVAVDIRKSSPTFGQHVSQLLSASNKKQMWIPEGFAHGFITLSNTSQFLYKTTDFFNPINERCIIWNDDYLNILWPKDLHIKLSAKDLLGKPLLQAEIFI